MIDPSSIPSLVKVELVRGNTNNRVQRWSFTCSECSTDRGMLLLDPTTKVRAKAEARKHYDSHHGYAQLPGGGP